MAEEQVELVEELSTKQVNRRFKYELYFPAASHFAGEPLPVVIILHGFGGKTSAHTEFAKGISRLGAIVLIPQLSLSAILKKSRHTLRQENIQGVAELARWLIERTEDTGDTLSGRVDAESIALVGHSAGGAVAFEAACVMQGSGMHPRALLLLDGVPWVSTIHRAKNNELNYSAGREIAADKTVCNVCNLRAKRASINAYGLFYQLFGASSESFVDVEFPAAKHADFADNAWKSCLFRVLGFATTEQTYDDIMRVCFGFLASALKLKGDAGDKGVPAGNTEELYCKVLNEPRNFVVEEVESKTVDPIIEKKLPLYLQ